MGMMDWVNDDEDDEGTDGIEEENELDDMDGFEDFDDEFDEGFEGETDTGNEAGPDDLDDFGDGFGDEFDEFGEDGGGGSGGGMNGDVAEKLADFEDRIGELETELGGLSSTMNTVREENKQIGETVDELDDTIRKLLDIYEMVTRGINPFVDDAREMGGLEHGDGAFGLFESEEEEEDDLDPDVVNADAESFFDEDFGDLDAEEAEARAEEAAEDELAESELDEPEVLDEGETGETEISDDPVASGDDSGGGVSFDDLKAEYDETDGWDDDVAEEDETPGESVIDDVAVSADADDEAGDADHLANGDGPGVDEETVDAAEEHVDDVAVDVELGGEDVDEGTLESDDRPEDPVTDDGGATDVPDPTDAVEPDTTAPDHVEPRSVNASVEPATVGDDDTSEEPTVGDRPSTSGGTDHVGGRERLGAERAAASDAYLSALPTTYVAESVAMEWMQFLVSTGGPLGAARALRLYEDFGWVSPEARETLDTYVRSVASPRDDAQNGSLTADHHETSLSYVSRLGDRTPESGALDALVADGGHDGIRR